MSRYIGLVKADLKYVGLALAGSDEFDVNIAAYHCQQAVEKTCGYVAQLNGLKSKRTHDILVWAEYLLDNNLYVPKDISDNADKITYWGSGTRYNINFVVARAEINKIKTAVEDWLDIVNAQKNVVVAARNRP